MNGLGLIGAGIAARKISGAYTGRTDKVGESSVLSDFLTTNGTSNVMSKMCGCFRRITTEELYNNRGFSALFGQTGETRKANTYRYLINHDKANITGELNADSKKKLLRQSEKAVQFSRQAEHLFCQIANSKKAQAELTQAKLHCEDLLYLYALRDKLSSSVMVESSKPSSEKIAALSQIQDDLNIINARIEKAEASFRKSLNAHLEKDDLSRVGFKEFMSQFQLLDSSTAQENPQKPSKYHTEDFIRFYAFKVKLMQDQNFRKQVQDDFRKYIFTTSVGHLDAGEKLAYQYGKLIKDLLDESSLGDVDSQSGNLSQYFMQTVYNLLNVGEPNFSLACLCIGKDDQSQTIEVPNFDGLNACPGSYYLTDEGGEIVKIIVDYYHELSTIVSNHNSSKPLLPPLNNSKKKTLVWNLVGGTHSEQNNKTKKGIFFRIDEQLKGFSSKTESAMHSKLDGFENKSSIFEDSPLDSFVNKLSPSPYLADPQRQGIFQYSYSIGQDAYRSYIKRLNILQRIAARCRLNDLEFSERQDSAKEGQLCRLRLNYKSLISRIDIGSQPLYDNYFKEILGNQLYKKFLDPAAEDGDDHAVPLKIDEVLRSTVDKVPPDLAGECIQSAKDNKKIVRQQKFNMILANEYDINTHINTYANTIDNLRKKLNESELFKDMQQIIAKLGDLKDVIKFYNNILNSAHENKEVGLIAAPTELITLAKLAVLDTKDQINQLYDRYKELDVKYKTSDVSLHKDNFQKCEQEIFEYSFLETLFDFIDKQSKAENSDQSPIQVDIILSNTVDTCVKKLGSMQYVTLATNTINALNSKRILLQLTNQKDLLIKFAGVFSIASTDKSTKDELQEFTNSMNDVIKDLEAKYKKLVENNNDGEENKKFNELCSRIHSWLLEIFINQGGKVISNKFSYTLENNAQEITLILPPHIAESCQKNYRELQNIDFSSENWGQVSQVHKTILKNLLDTENSIVSKMTLYLGQLFSDGFTYNPETKDIPHFQRLLASYETAVMDNLTALNAMGYLHQELLGHYAKLIGGVGQLVTINTTVALRSKLLMALLSYNVDSNLEKKFVCELTKKEKKLYLELLYKSNLHKSARTNREIPEMVLNEQKNPRVNNFDSHSPQMFAEPAEIIQQLLAYQNNDNPKVVDAPLTNYAVSTANMVDEIKTQSEKLHQLLTKSKEELGNLKEGIDQISTKLKGSEKLVVNEDTIDNCNELLQYFESKITVSEGNGLNPEEGNVDIKEVNTLHLADIYNKIFNSLFTKIAGADSSTECAKIKIEFDNAYEDMRKAALCGDIALFSDISKEDMLNLKENKALEDEIIRTIKVNTNNHDLSSIERPLNSKTIKNVYEVCSAHKDPDTGKLVRIYLNAFQYKKIEQSLAKFYISASNNLPKLATNLSSLYKLAGILNATQAIIRESETDKREMERLIVNSNGYLNTVADSITKWKSLLLDNNKYAWLVQSRYNVLEKDHKRYFEWFAETYLKLDIVNSGVVGPLRDELQFMVILDYLKVYKDIGENHLSPEDIDLIKRFYYSPKEIHNDQLKKISEVLGKIHTFLNKDQGNRSLIDELFTQINHVWQKIADWFIHKEDDAEVNAIKHKLQDLYNLFYLEIIKRGHDSLTTIQDENTRLNNIKETFEAICNTQVFIALSDQFKKVKKVNTAAELYSIFQNNAEKFRSIAEHPKYSDMLNLIIDGVQARNPKVEKVYVTFIKKIINGEMSKLSSEELVEEAREQLPEMMRAELGTSFVLTGNQG